QREPVASREAEDGRAGAHKETDSAALHLLRRLRPGLNGGNRIGRGKCIFQTYLQRLLETVAFAIMAFCSALARLSVRLSDHRVFLRGIPINIHVNCSGVLWLIENGRREGPHLLAGSGRRAVGIQESRGSLLLGCSSPGKRRNTDASQSNYSRQGKGLRDPERSPRNP